MADLPEPDQDAVQRAARFLRGLRAYFRLRADGLEQVPDGPALLVANHTGWLGLDYAMTALTVLDEKGRLVRGMVHPAWFRARASAEFARRVGLHEVRKNTMQVLVGAGHLVMVFPEGERGAFRASTGYRLAPFARGFVRVAAATGVPVVPVCVVGGEEANPVERTVDSYERLLALPLPVPKNLIPRPVKWRLRFLPPVTLDVDPADREAVHAAADHVRALVQDGVAALVKDRGHPYL